jgi:polyisoprenoid-binding protein YceI
VFENYHGTLTFNPQKPEESRIELTIDSKSAVCKDTWVSANDLKKIMETTFDDMLAVKQFPTMTFTSAAIKAVGTNQFEAQGTLTIRNKPKPITLNVRLDVTDPAKLRLRGNAKIHLKDYGLKPPSALLGAIGTKEEMSLEFEVVGTL